MTTKVPDITLNDGRKMPMIGLGTWRAPTGVVGDAVKLAIDIGYRHIDEAYIYMNEKEVGEAIKEKIADGTVTREDLYIVSKAWGTYRTRERVVLGFKKSLELFGLDYLDLFLIHFPISFTQTDDVTLPKDADGNVVYDDNVDYLDTWRGMEDLVKAGLVKSIGVSNFNIDQIKRIIDNCEIKPVTNQIECHPYFSRPELVKQCQELGVVVTAYSPIATPERLQTMNDVPQLLENETLKEIAGKYNKTTAQVALRYQLDRNAVIIPKSVKEDHLRDNFNVFDFSLAPEDMKKIDGMDINGRLFNSESMKGSKYYPW